ncbi:MAG: hypothetical protein AB8H03_28505 [Saprospiraceae bacterium]
MTNFALIPLEIKVTEWPRSATIVPMQQFYDIKVEDITAKSKLSVRFTRQAYKQLMSQCREIEKIIIEYEKDESNLAVVVILKERLEYYGMSFLFNEPRLISPLTNINVYMYYLDQAFHYPERFPNIFNTIDLKQYIIKKNKPYNPTFFFEGLGKGAKLNLDNLFLDGGFATVNLGVPITKEFNLKKNKWFTRLYVVGGFRYFSVNKWNLSTPAQVSGAYLQSGAPTEIIDNSGLILTSRELTSAIRMKKIANPAVSYDLEIGVVAYRKAKLTIKDKAFDASEELNLSEFTDVFGQHSILKNAYLNLGLNFFFPKHSRKKRNFIKLKSYDSRRGLGLRLFGGIMQYEQKVNDKFPLLGVNNLTLNLKSSQYIIFTFGGGLFYAF